MNSEIEAYTSDECMAASYRLTATVHPQKSLQQRTSTKFEQEWNEPSKDSHGLTKLAQLENSQMHEQVTLQQATGVPPEPREVEDSKKQQNFLEEMSKIEKRREEIQKKREEADKRLERVKKRREENEKRWEENEKRWEENDKRREDRRKEREKEDEKAKEERMWREIEMKSILSRMQEVMDDRIAIAECIRSQRGP